MATVHFVGVADIQFRVQGAIVPQWDFSTLVDTAFAPRGAPRYAGAAAHTNYVWGLLWNGAVGDLWATVAIAADVMTNPSGNLGGSLFELVSGSTPLVRLRRNAPATSGTAHYVTMQWWDGSAWQDVGTYTGWTASTVTRFAMRVKLDASGEMGFYVNGTEIGTFTGDTDGGGTSVDRLWMRGWVDSPSTTSPNLSYSETAVTDSGSSLRYARVAGMYPDAAPGGAHPVAWTGDWQNIDETTLSEADLISTTTTDAAESWRVQQRAAAASGATVLAFGQSAWARRGATGPQNLRLPLYVSGTEYSNGDVAGLSAAFAEVREIFYADPSTSAAPTPAAVDAFRWGAKATA